MRKACSVGKVRPILILVVIVSVVAALTVYRLYHIKRTQAVFSEDGLIVGDGLGPYEDGSKGAHLVFSIGFYLDLNESSRSVYVKFGDALWKDKGLRDISPLLPSKNYRGFIWIEASGVTRVEHMEVGERLEPQFIAMLFYDGDTGGFAGFAVRTARTGTTSFDTSFTMDITSAPEPPPPLYGEGHVYLLRSSEDTWIIDADAWFTLFQKTPGGGITKHYVKLTFKITVTM